MSTHQQERRTDRDRQTPTEQSSRTGLVSGRMTRAGGLLIGTVLLLQGLRRQSVGGIVLAAVGAGVVARTLRGEAGGEKIDSSRLLSRSSSAEEQTALSASRSVTVDESPDELYEVWRDPETFTQIMGHFAEVTSTDGDRYHWTVHGPAGMYPSWETQIVESRQGELIRWESAPEATVPNSGSVRFRPAAGNRGTVVTLSLDFDPPGGPIGTTVLKQLNVVPETLAGHALGRFKSLVESGEIPSLEGNPSGRGQGDLL